MTQLTTACILMSYIRNPHQRTHDLANININVRVPALEKLLDVVYSGIGAVARPMLAPWRAQKEADARAIEEKSKANSLVIIADAQRQARNALTDSLETSAGTLNIGKESIFQRVEFQEQKRQANIQSVVEGAANELHGKEVEDHDPDLDWTARFFTDVQDVSSIDLQKIWSRVLAREVESPGATTMRTLSILKNMSRSDAEIFTQFADM